MDSQGQRNAVSGLVSILRKVTRVAQLVPFVYLAVYAVLLLAEPVLPEVVMEAADNLLYLPPFCVVLMLAASRWLKLCVWHKTACVMPLASRVEDFVDSYVVTLTQGEVVAVNIFIGCAVALFLAAAVRHFFFPYGRKQVYL